MEWFESIVNQNEVNFHTILLRLLLSLVIGGCIGWERERRQQPAGLRTHILIALGSTLLMLISIHIPQTFKNFQNGDPGRIAAQVVSGIGFLGAGAIFRLGINIKGLTTAATIWVVAAIGLAIGSGLYTGALVCTVLILFVLIVLDKVEDAYFPQFSTKTLQVIFQTPQTDTTGVFIVLSQFKIKHKSFHLSHALDGQLAKLRLIIQIPKGTEMKKLYRELSKLPDIHQITIGQDV